VSRTPYALAESVEKRLAYGVCLWLAALLAVFVVVSLHWPMVGDSVLMHYVVLLMQHGMKPYRDIVDMNLPGSYLLDAAEMWLFGTGALAWRVYDFGLMASASAALAVILRRRGRLAMVLAAALFALIHGMDGILMTGERDFAGSVLLLAAVACIFTVLRRGRASLISGLVAGGFGALLGFACCVKPTFLLMGFCLVCWAEWMRRRTAISRGALFLPAVCGFLLPLLGCVVFLSMEDALPAFAGEVRGLIPYHSSIDPRSLGYLLMNCLSPLAGMFFLWLAAGWLLRGRRSDPERIALALCALCGLLSYLLQRKGFWYQRYPLTAFLLPLFMTDFSELGKSRRWPKLVGITGMALGVVVASQCLLRLMRIDRQEPTPSLLRDLEGLSRPAEMSGHVQCMDTFGGCLDALYDGGIAQSTGFLYDCYLMGDRGQDKNGSIVADLRRHFWEEMARNPPRMIVVTDSVCYEPARSFDKYAHWPEFQTYLANNYVLVKQSGEQVPVHYWSRPMVPFGYRIYDRRSDIGAALGGKAR
jgi:hypothetical protein